MPSEIKVKLRDERGDREYSLTPDQAAMLLLTTSYPDRRITLEYTNKNGEHIRQESHAMGITNHFPAANTDFQITDWVTGKQFKIPYPADYRNAQDYSYQNMSSTYNQKNLQQALPDFWKPEYDRTFVNELIHTLFDMENREYQYNNDARGHNNLVSRIELDIYITNAIAKLPDDKRENIIRTAVQAIHKERQGIDIDEAKIDPTNYLINELAKEYESCAMKPNPSSEGVHPVYMDEHLKFKKSYLEEFQKSLTSLAKQLGVTLPKQTTQSPFWAQSKGTSDVKTNQKEAAPTERPRSPNK